MDNDRYDSYNRPERYSEPQRESIRDMRSEADYARSRGEEYRRPRSDYGDWYESRRDVENRSYDIDAVREYNERYGSDRSPFYDRGAGGEWGGEVHSSGVYTRYHFPRQSRSRTPYEYREDQEQRGWWDRASDEVSSWFGDEEAQRRREIDQAGRGAYRGRGPRNYRRSDERICDDINDRLTDNPYLDAYDIQVSATGGDVLLSGTVRDRYSKRLAEDIAEDVSGVHNVENRLRVDKEHISREVPITEGESSASTTKSATTRGD